MYKIPGGGQAAAARPGPEARVLRWNERLGRVHTPVKQADAD